MPCVAAPSVPLPDLSLLLPELDLSPPTLGITFCCKFETPPVPGTPIILSIGLLPGIAVVLQPVMAVIMIAIDLLNALLDELQFACPLE